MKHTLIQTIRSIGSTAVITLWLVGGCGHPEASSDKKTSEDTTTDSATGAQKSTMTSRLSQNGAASGDLQNAAGREENTIDKGVRPPAAPPETERFDPPVFPLPKPGQMIEIEGGSFLRGSAPQDILRDQFAENDHIPTTMTSFEMDVLPWPNDPIIPALTGVSQAEARQLCATKGKRLCTELEWEWACRGPDSRRYHSGDLYNEIMYRSPHGSPSPWGVWGIGMLLEITSSAWGTESDQVSRMAVRGYAPNQIFVGKEVSAQQGRRCAKRWWFNPGDTSPDMGFRCCKGPINTAACFIERPRPPHSIYKTMKPEKFAQVIRSIPELEAVHDNPHMFSPADIRAVLAKRGTDRQALETQGIHFVWKPVRWIPRQGMELWIGVGRSNRHSFVVALHEVEDNEVYVHASSFIVWDNPLPLALVYREGHRAEVYWAPCWRCRDGGSILYDEDKNDVMITHRW